MNALALFAWVLLPALGIALAAHRYWRYRTTQRARAVVVSVATRPDGRTRRAASAEASESACMVDIVDQEHTWRVRLRGRRSRQPEVGTTLIVYFPKGQPAKASEWQLKGFWIALAFCFAPAFALLLLIGEHWLARELHAAAFDPLRKHYLATNARVLISPLPMVFPLVAGVLLWQAHRQRRRSLPGALARFALPAAILLGFSGTWLYSKLEATHTCTAADASVRSETIKGSMDVAGAIRNIQGRPSNTFEVIVDGRRFESAGFKRESECGFRASVAQSMPLPVGSQVELRVVGNVIVELRVD